VAILQHRSKNKPFLGCFDWRKTEPERTNRGVETTAGLVMLRIGRSVDGRQPISRTDLQSAITEAVKQSGPGCEAFVDVIVEDAKPKSQYDANWAIRGVKFGRSDREKASQAIAVIVERMQREFRLSEDPARTEATNKSRPG
jgi:hypothetical protein